MNDKPKSTGMVRRTDNLGRIVLPIEIRRNMGLSTGDSLEIFVEGAYVVLKKYVPFCIFCGSSNKIKNYNGQNICAQCVKEIKRL